MKKTNKALMLLVSLWMPFMCMAQAPAGYYTSAEGKNKGALLKALEGIVGSHTNVGYDGLWSIYPTSDNTADGYVWDMYSTAKFQHGKKQCGNYSKIGDCYNREHSFPKSWFSKASPMVSDAFHIYPTDGKVNGQRSNFPYGECANGTYVDSYNGIKALGKLGTSTFAGYSGKVFEPDDQYKGDFARTYFYMAAAYNSKISNWGSDMLSNNSYPCFTQWSINLLMKWNREDPVSQKEIDRNNAVYVFQKNRNPFIDHPELAEYIWGTKVNEGWTPGGNVDPMIVNPETGTSYDCGVTAVGTPVTVEIPVKAIGITEELSAIVRGGNFSVNKSVIGITEANNGTTLTVTFNPTTVGNLTATLEIGNGEIGTSVTLKGTSVDGIPASAGTLVTASAFTANWVNISGNVKYNLSVFESDGTTLCSGYPVQVQAADQSYRVTDLNCQSDYYYQLSYGSLTSNKVKVTTADPEKILAFSSEIPEGGIVFSLLPGAVSNIEELGIYSEYITENISVAVEGNFEVSLDKTNWSNEINGIDPEGENFYVRVKDTSAEGVFKGVVSLSTDSFEGEELDLTASVAAPRSFFEDFEEMVTTTYETRDNIQGTACKWNLKDAGVWGSSSDRFNDKQSLRLGKTATSSLEMAEDKFNGASTLSFYAAVYGTDSDAKLVASYSLDGGTSWTSFNEVTVSEAILKEYKFTINATGAVRIKIEQTEGKRVSIDDISITDYNNTAITSVVNDRNWDAYYSNGVVLENTATINVNIYSMEGVAVYQNKLDAGKRVINLPQGVYVVVVGDESKKIIVK